MKQTPCIFALAIGSVCLAMSGCDRRDNAPDQTSPISPPTTTSPAPSVQTPSDPASGVGTSPTAPGTGASR
jgi:hypothetical protein